MPITTDQLLDFLKYELGWLVSHKELLIVAYVGYRRMRKSLHSIWPSIVQQIADKVTVNMDTRLKAHEAVDDAREQKLFGIIVSDRELVKSEIVDAIVDHVHEMHKTATTAATSTTTTVTSAAAV